MDKSKVVHYFDKIGVGVVKLSESLAVGDKIKVTGKDYEFTQTVSSMQQSHQPVTEADKGTEVALKLDQPVKNGDSVEKIS